MMDKDMADAILKAFQDEGNRIKLQERRDVLLAMGDWILEQPVAIQLEAIDMFDKKMAQFRKRLEAR